MKVLSCSAPAGGILLLVMAAVAAATIGQSAEAPSVLSGAFSEEQAIRGQTLYYENCLACHGETMAGLDQAPPLAGPQFSGIWEGETLWALVTRIGTMPPDRPGDLTRAENVDILTYILWYNGLPLGEEALDTEQSVLAEMSFQLPPPADQ